MSDNAAQHAEHTHANHYVKIWGILVALLWSHRSARCSRSRSSR